MAFLTTNKPTTLFSITNVSSNATIVHVTLWDAKSNPELDFGADFAHMMGVPKRYDDVARMYFILHSDHESGIKGYRDEGDTRRGATPTPPQK